MTAPVFIHPAFSRTTPRPEPIRWRMSADLKAMAAYIRASLLQARAGLRRPQ